MKEKEIMIDFLSDCRIKISGKPYPKKALAGLNEDQLKKIIQTDEKLYDLYKTYREERIGSHRRKTDFVQTAIQLMEERSDMRARELARVLKSLPFNTVETKLLLQYMKTFNDYGMIASSLCIASYAAAQIEYNGKAEQKRSG